MGADPAAAILDGMSGSPAVLWYFVDAAGKWHRGEASKSLIARKAATAEGRLRSFSPDECKALGLEFPSEWSEDGGAKAEATNAKAAAKGLDDVDLPPEAAPVELEPERVEPPPPPEVAPDPEVAGEPVEVAPPAAPAAAPEDPEGASPVSGDPMATMRGLPPQVLTSLVATGAVRGWCALVVWASTPKGCKPIPLTPEETAEIDGAMRAVLAVYARPSDEAPHAVRSLHLPNL